MSFATKLNYIIYKDGSHRLVMKRPKTDGGKLSLPGILQVRRDANNKQLYVLPRQFDEKVEAKDNILKVVYDHGPVAGAFDDFSTVRERVKTEWKQTDKTHDPISTNMKQLIQEWVKKFDVDYAKEMNVVQQQAQQQ